MSASEREAIALAKLLKISRLKADEASRKLAELEAALSRARASLLLLEEAVSSEEAAASAAEVIGFAQLAGFLAGAAQKRMALETTKRQLEAELTTARTNLEASFSEASKLEHLVERSRLADLRRERRLEAARLNEAAIAGFSRRSVR